MRTGQCFSFFSSTWPSTVSLQWHKSSTDPNATWAGDRLGYDSVMCNKPGGSCAGANKSWPVTNDEYGYFGTNPENRTCHRNTI